jgi:hypothetical protein
LRAGSRWPQTPTPHSKRLDDIVFSTSGASLCSHVAVLKIDVENHELEVWRMAPIGRFLGIVCVFYGNGSLSAAATHVLGLQSVTRVGGFGIIEVGKPALALRWEAIMSCRSSVAAVSGVGMGRVAKPKAVRRWAAGEWAAESAKAETA